MITVVLKSGEIITGTVDEETEGYFLIDEDRAFGDVVVIMKSDIQEIRTP